MHVEKSSVICQLFGLVSAQQYTLSFKMPKATHRLCATSQGFTDWLSTSTTLGKVLSITEAKASLVFFYLTGFPSVLQSVSVRILICHVNIILVSSVAKTTFKRWARKQTQLQRLQDTSVFHLNLDSLFAALLQSSSPYRAWTNVIMSALYYQSLLNFSLHPQQST